MSKKELSSLVISSSSKTLEKNDDNYNKFFLQNLFILEEPLERLNAQFVEDEINPIV